jgi:hypothetical protein
MGRAARRLELSIRQAAETSSLCKSPSGRWGFFGLGEWKDELTAKLGAGGFADDRGWSFGRS